MIQREGKGVFPVQGHVLAERPSLRAPPNGGVTRRRRRAPPIRRLGAGNPLECNDQDEAQVNEVLE